MTKCHFSAFWWNSRLWNYHFLRSKPLWPRLIFHKNDYFTWSLNLRVWNLSKIPFLTLWPKVDFLGNFYHFQVLKYLVLSLLTKTHEMTIFLIKSVSNHKNDHFYTFFHIFKFVTIFWHKIATYFQSDIFGINEVQHA